MLSVEEALARILAAFETLPAETVSLTEARGRVLAEDVVARVDQPPQAVSAMDGYAVRAADLATLPVTLTQVGEAPAGGAYAGRLEPGQCVRIFTGGPLPAGADAIVIQEDVEAEGSRITVAEAVAPGTFVRPAGLDFRTGDIGAHAGRPLTGRDIGLAAAMNVPWLQVRRRQGLDRYQQGRQEDVHLVAHGELVVLLPRHQVVGGRGARHFGQGA